MSLLTYCQCQGRRGWGYEEDQGIEEVRVRSYQRVEDSVGRYPEQLHGYFFVFPVLESFSSLSSLPSCPPFSSSDYYSEVCVRALGVLCLYSPVPKVKY
jgi:hypothetical protein